MFLMPVADPPGTILGKIICSNVRTFFFKILYDINSCLRRCDAGQFLSTVQKNTANINQNLQYHNITQN
jgi:hypothetical protein